MKCITENYQMKERATQRSARRYADAPHCYAMISFNPSMIWINSSRDALQISFPILSTESVRIWLILAHDRFGMSRFWSLSVNGNPAFWGWLVIATAITVPEWSLKTSWLKIKTGRNPDCSRPLVGLRSAHRISPLSIAAIDSRLQPNLLQPLLFQR